MRILDALDRGRMAFRAHAWREAYAQLSAADIAAPLASDDLELLATSAYLIGNDEISAAIWARAHNEHLRTDDVRRAARCVFWMILELLSIGEWARASGWLTATDRLLDQDHVDCAERGLLLVLTSRRCLKEGDVSAAWHTSSNAAAIGDHFNDPDVKVFGRLAQGLVHVRTGEARAAAGLFDEVMVAVTRGDMSPIGVGVVYCAVIEGCYEILDVARAREWTAALSRWCSSQPDLVPFRGHCLVHRAQTMRLTGAWSDAIQEAERVCGHVSQLAEPDDSETARFVSPRGYPVGGAFYELAEVQRLRGNFGEAEEAYRRASLHGQPPDPGLALLRLAQGRIEAAETAIRRVLDQPQKRLTRANVLAACVEVMVAAHDLATARAAADELSSISDSIDAALPRALAAQAKGTLLLSESEPRAALGALRAAWMEWQAIEAPYDAARVRVMMGLACRQLGDEDAAGMELDAARHVFVRLGAAPDIDHVNELLASARASDSRCLTPRELQVIRLIAAGRTNRAIARELAISERTVDRHVSNILTKLDLSSRSAATAYAYQHHLV